jgi:hypothetical protein
MINRLFGNYLVETGKITQAQLDEVIETQKKVRVKLGLIAVAEKLMTPEQADEVNHLQAIMDKRYGDIAVEKGYLTDEQVGRLLGLQGNAYLTFIQALDDCKYMTPEESDAALAEYQKDNSFTATDIDALKSGDADRIVPLFLPSEVTGLQAELVQGAVRALIRLIDSDTYVLKGAVIDAFEADRFALQDMDGDHAATLSFAADGDALKAIADVYGQEDFAQVDLDALDAVGEFINCVNGMFSTKLSGTCNMDMLPPSYKDARSTAKAGKICVLPICVNGKIVNMLSAFDETIGF